MEIRLRQIALVARELEPSVEALTATLGIEIGFRDPGVAVFGLENAVMPIGETFLEVVSPAREGTTAGRYLERRKGDGGYMVILQTRELDAERRRMEQLGVRIVWEVDTERGKAIHLHPRDVGGAILSFDQMTDWEAWEWAGPEWRAHVRTDVSEAIVAAELQAEDPERLAARWAEVIDRPHEGLAIPLDAGALRFVEAVDGRGEGLAGIDVATRDAARRGTEQMLCGTRIRFV